MIGTLFAEMHSQAYLRGMSTRSGTGARTEALRRAQEVTARRDTERLQREQAVRQSLADFFQAEHDAARIRADAQQRADRLLAAADVAACSAEVVVRTAVHRLAELGESRQAIRELTGLSAQRLRELLQAEALPAASETLSVRSGA